MRVSVTLHREQPANLEGNQRQVEARYCGFNRQYAELLIDPVAQQGSCIFNDLRFPNVAADPEVLTWFSIGICENVPADTGGTIIIAGPLQQPIDAKVDTTPSLSAMIGVNGDRLKRLGLLDKGPLN